MFPIIMKVLPYIMKVLQYFGLFAPAVKMMKAPGQPGVQILREVFEKDAASYFRNLRNNG